MLDGGGQRGRVARPPRREAARRRGRDGQGRQVAGDLEVDGLAAPQRRVDRPVDHRGRLVQAANGEGPGRHLGVDLPLVVVTDLAQGVVDEPPFRLRVAVDPADDGDDRQVFGVGAGHGVQGAEPADAVGDDERPDAVGPGVPLGGITRVQLVAAADELKARVLQ